MDLHRCKHTNYKREARGVWMSWLLWHSGSTKSCGHIHKAEKLTVEHLTVLPRLNKPVNQTSNQDPVRNHWIAIVRIPQTLKPLLQGTFIEVDSPGHKQSRRNSVQGCFIKLGAVDHTFLLVMVQEIRTPSDTFSYGS